MTEGKPDLPLPVNGTLYKLLLWAIVSLLGWDIWQTNENSKNIVAIMAESRSNEGERANILAKLNSEDAALHQIANENRENVQRLLEELKTVRLK